MMDTTLILALTDIVQKPKAERLNAIQAIFADKSKDEVLAAFHSVFWTGVDYAASCDETLHLHLVTTGDIHPYTVEKLNMPSFQGALHGLILAQKAPKQAVLCESCAYRCGTLANHSLTTQADLAYAIKNEKVFYCHKDIENLDCPTSEDRKRMKPCKGWAQHIKESGEKA
ncbi:hypothetical protein LVY74_01675 [Acinetobacter sp. ME22]|uniref:hypothetical protein n=1 Tax=Acinetobacter sp. ME22 TaxID=2904802 RepID=UPI001EDA0467|nr:hypothetical protein [Acinetobacter sp. ME22]MCG2572266.1 hypothetical protein [Acinetobacter sp. ME22]